MTITEQPPITRTMQAEVLSESISGREQVTVSIQVSGAFTRPGNRIEIAPMVIVATIPATVLPDAETEEL